MFCFIVLVFYYLYFFNSLELSEDKDEMIKEIGISIIVCSRNEASNLELLIPKLLKQNYSNFEIVLVNHGSSDRTKEVIKNYQSTDNRIKYLEVPFEDFHSKKYALNSGIHFSNNEFIVLTDSDCTVQSNDWLKIYSQYFQKKDIVLGYGPYQKKSGFLNLFIRFDTFLIAAQYFSFAKKGVPYMGVGRNLGYRKEIFKKNNGFEKHLDLKSGDDDLFIQEVASANNTVICLDKAHFVKSIPEQSWINFFNQKRRHLSTGNRYKLKSKFLVALYPSSVLAFSALMALFVGVSDHYVMVVLLYFLKIIIQWTVFKKISKTLGEKDLWIFSPILELMTVIYNGIVAMSLFASKKIEWK